ncbi:MAG: helix-turn-helix domain-containing protein [Gemmatimonadota bacterium]|nr:helix-turn-helix domain-containing protein [Gemmatimonadota bacterium]
MTRPDSSKPHVLRNEAECNAAVSEIDGLLDADPETGSEAYERLEFLSVLVQAFEDVRFPVDETMEPREVVDFMLEQKGLARTDLAEWLGGRSRVSEFYNGKRSLSIRQIRRLTENLGISADLLITHDRKR